MSLSPASHVKHSSLRAVVKVIPEHYSKMILSKCAENGVDSFAAATDVLGYAGSRRRTESNVGSCDFGCLRLRVPSRHNSLPTSLRSLTENVNACWSNATNSTISALTLTLGGENSRSSLDQGGPSGQVSSGRSLDRVSAVVA